MVDSNNFLKNSVVVVTGGTSGIGKSIVIKCAQKGATTCFCARNEQNVTALAKYLLENDYHHFFSAVSDVSNSQQVQSFINNVIEKFGQINVLVSNAGIGTFKLVEEFKDEEWQNILGINLSGYFNVCRAGIDAMRKNQSNPRGYIINIGSLSHRLYVSGNGVYAATKAAQSIISNYLFEELRHDNIFVTYLALGSVNTPFSMRNPNGNWKIQSDDVADIVLQYIQHYLTNPSCCISYSEIRVRHPKRITETPMYKE